MKLQTYPPRLKISPRQFRVGALLMVPWQIGKTTGTHKAKTVIPLNQRHVPRTSKARRQSLSSQNTHTKETQAKRRTNGFTAHGSMTWQNITKIPRKTPNFQFLRDSIFYHARFLYTAPQLNPLQPFLSPLAPKTKPSQHNANPRSNKTTFSLFLSHRVFFADSETLTRTESPRFRNSSSSILFVISPCRRPKPTLKSPITGIVVFSETVIRFAFNSFFWDLICSIWLRSLFSFVSFCYCRWLFFHLLLCRLGWSAKALEQGGSNRRKPLRIRTSRRGLRVLSLFSCMYDFFVFFVCRFESVSVMVIGFRFVCDCNDFIDFIFFNCYRSEFREQYKKEHPNNKSVAAVSNLVFLLCSENLDAVILFFRILIRSSTVKIRLGRQSWRWEMEIDVRCCEYFARLCLYMYI